MSFQEKSNLVVLAAFLTVYGWYFFKIIGMVETAGGPVEGYQPLLIVMVVGFVVLVIAAHIVITILSPAEADMTDERDRAISRFGEYVGGYVLATGTLVALGLTMAEVPHFFIAHAILAALVLAEIVGDVVKLVLYRRGV